MGAPVKALPELGNLLAVLMQGCSLPALHIGLLLDQQRLVLPDCGLQLLLCIQQGAAGAP